MPGPDDRDTAIDHQPDHGSVDDRWTPGGTPPAPGWYEDPWNANAIRRWDGHDWTGEAAPKGSSPDSPPQPPQMAEPHDAPRPPTFSRVPAAGLGLPGPSPAPAPSRRTRRANPLLVAGIAAAVVVVAVVVVMSGHGGSTSTSTTLAPAPPSTVAGPVGLAGSVLNASDLGKGWTATPPAHALTAPEYTQGPCGSSFWAHNVAGYTSSFVNGASAATAHGSVVTKVVQAPTVAISDQQQSVINAPAYAACLKQTVTSEVRSQLVPGSGENVTTVNITPFSLNLTFSNHAFVISVTVARPGGATRQVTVNAVVIFSGRYAATIDVSWSSDAPLSGQIVQQQASNEASHLTSLG
jgi:hypothetical protein